MTRSSPSSGGRSSRAGTVTLSEDAAHHMRVARVAAWRSASRCAMARGRGARNARQGLAQRRRSSTCLETQRSSSVPADHLLAPVADRDRMLWLAEKATELGITSWRPVMWRRSKSVSPRGEGPMFQAKVRARMTRRLIQSGGAWLPDIFPMRRSSARSPRRPPARGCCSLAMASRLHRVPIGEPVTIALGPEGGMEADERDASSTADFSLCDWRRARYVLRPRASPASRSPSRNCSLSASTHGEA